MKGIRKRLIRSGLILCLSLMVLAGCGNPSDATPSDNEAKEERLIKHAMGETEVPAKPKRVVVLTNEGLESLLSVGVKPVGAVEAFTGEGTWYHHLEEEMDGVESVGTELQPNLEKIASLKPDLIIGNKMRQEKIYDQLSGIAPTVFAESLRAQWKNNFKLYTDTVNKKEEGEAVIADFDKRVEEIRERAGDKLSTEVSLVRFMPGVTRIYYNDTFGGVILKEIGFNRPSAQDLDDFAAEVTKERIPEMEGDVLFYFTYEEKGSNEGTELEKEWTQDPLWKKLEVVKEGKAYKVDDTVWTTAGGVKAANLLLDDLEKYLLDEK
ncbi:ABC transporter substrate-binding protein [Desmospora profundinema]|uniref:Iron complex transport system substrate-binding protein n=1 Tax=Desmospora profundinema TaxID=1571184 RepID=A0ABU1IQR9_9BACL|nr:iron-siderophore ABC transporter substrate-binding protein [Desmospora profundinema]MDR6226090.1 iron complex transport system substrate-binding protein [Desmospora profundinema]